MEPRLNYRRLAPEGFARMTALEHYLNGETGLERPLLEFVRLLASKMNGCEYCIALHTEELRKLGEPEERINGIVGVPELFSARERAALDWTAAVTNIQEGHAPDAVYEAVRAHFSEAETVNLTLTITTINAWNRLAIGLGAHPARG
jgi:AhpD family alkylhydroperoxidase